MQSRHTVTRKYEKHQPDAHKAHFIKNIRLPFTLCPVTHPVHVFLRSTGKQSAPGDRTDNTHWRVRTERNDVFDLPLAAYHVRPGAFLLSPTRTPLVECTLWRNAHCHHTAYTDLPPQR